MREIFAASLELWVIWLTHIDLGPNPEISIVLQLPVGCSFSILILG